MINICKIKITVPIKYYYQRPTIEMSTNCLKPKSTNTHHNKYLSHSHISPYFKLLYRAML